MVRPLVRLVRDDEGHRNWDFDSGAAALQLAFAGDVPLGDFALEGGTVIFEDRQSGVSERLDSVNLAHRLAERAPAARRRRVGHLARRAGDVLGRSADGAVSLPERRRDAARGAASKSAPIAADLQRPGGRLSAAEADRALEALDAVAPPFRLLARQPDRPRLDARAGERLRRGRFRRRTGFRLRTREFTLDGNSAYRRAEDRVSPKLDVTGTLAFDALDLSPYFAGLSGRYRDGGDWRDVSLLDRIGSHDMNADIRLSAKPVQLREPELRATPRRACRCATAGWRSASRAAAFSGGSLAGDIAVTDAGQRRSGDSRRSFARTKFAFAVAAPSLGLPQAISGTASVLRRRDHAGRRSRLAGARARRHRAGQRRGRRVRSSVSPMSRRRRGARDPFPRRSRGSSPVKNLSAGFSFSAGIGMLERAMS